MSYHTFLTCIIILSKRPIFPVHFTKIEAEKKRTTLAQSNRAVLSARAIAL